jgi:hypothetical protein
VVVLVVVGSLAMTTAAPGAPVGTISTVAGTGAAGFAGDGGPAAGAQLSKPNELATDAAGNVLIPDSDNNRVRLLAAHTCSNACAYGLGATVAGDIYTIAGNGTAGFAGDGGPATAAQLSFPESAAADPAGNVLIADVSNSRVRVLAARTCSHACAYGLGATVAGDIYTIAGNGNPAFGGDGGPAGSAQLSPNSAVDDAAGNVLITDNNSRIRMLAAHTCSHACAYGLPATLAGNIYTIAGTGTAGFAGDGGPAGSAQLAEPVNIGIDRAGNVLIADLSNNRIRMLAAHTCSHACAYGLGATVAEHIYTVAGTGNPGTPTGADGEGGPATAAQLSQPGAVTLDPAGNMLIADANNRIRMVAAHTCTHACAYGLPATLAGHIYTVAGTGDPGTPTGTDGDGGSATAAQIDDPFGVAVDTTGHLFIADLNNRVREVTGAPLGGGSGPSISPDRLSGPAFHHSHRCSAGGAPASSNDPGPC